MAPEITLVARLAASAADARRGVVRLHPEVLDALGLRSWDAVTLTGARVTTALVAPSDTPPGQATLDDVTLSNAGLVDGAAVVVAPAVVFPARSVRLTGSRLARAALSPETVRVALIGKVLTGGDAVSLLPRDVDPAPGADAITVRRRVSDALGTAWTSELLTVAAVDPPGAVAVRPTTVVGWEGGEVTDPAAARAGTSGSAALGSGVSSAGVVGVGATASGPAASGSAASGAAGSGAGASVADPTRAGGLGADPTRAGGLGADPSGAGAFGAATSGASASGAGAAPASGAGPGGRGASMPTVPAAYGTSVSRSSDDPVGVARPLTDLPVAIEDLVGRTDAAHRLVEWLELTFDRPDLLVRLGGSARLGVLLVGPEGVGKLTLARSAAAAADAGCVELAAPGVAALEAGGAVARVQAVLANARARARSGARTVLVVTDIEALLPAASPPPLATLVLDALRDAVTTPRLAFVATTAAPEAVDPRLRAPELVDRELRLGLPDLRTRTELLRRLLAEVPLADDVDLRPVAERAPGFVAADLVAVRREAAVQAVLRHGDDARVAQQDLLDAVGSVRPVSMSSSQTLQTGGVTLDQVGDMAEVKQALTEAVLWPLRYPDSFARLGVAAPRGVLVYGPPGCGKTFLLRALAGTGQLNVLAVKGAELLDKYVGASERAVRELFRRASDAAPALVLLDEIDALAPRRGQSTDSGVADRVVAALLTELDGAQPLRDVIVVGATNRPELIDPALLRPGRLERLIYVPPPDAAARADILRAASRNTPLAPDVDLDALGADLDGYSAADCAAVLREAALAAMRESMDAAQVTAAHLAAACKAVPPSLDPAQLALLEAYAHRREQS